MRMLPLVRSEFARLTATRIGIASLIALMTVPVVYGALYLWGNQDPYSNLDQVPAAIVVDDTGATVDGKQVNYGRDAATTLRDDATFGWVVVDAAAAARGVRDGAYDFAITFPAHFSSDLASAGEKHPTTAQLVLTTNDTNSYLSTTLAKQAAAAVRASVTASVGEHASTTMLTAISDIRTGLVEAGDGAARLATGAATAQAGAAQLSTGLETLRAGAATLPARAASLDNGAHSVASGLASAAHGAASLSSTTAAAAGLAPTVRDQVAAAFSGSGIDDTTRATILAELDGLSSYTAGIDSAVSGSLAPSLSALSSGASSLASGTAQLAASAPQLTAGITSAADGASTLASGVAELDAGSAQLRDSLASGIGDVPQSTASERSATAAAISQPLSIDQHALTEAGTYGAGLAPFFLSLAAWIGIYALFLIVRPLSRRALTAGQHPIRTTLAGWAVPAALGVVQMVALFLVSILALHLGVANAAGLLAFMVLVSITFAAIVLALNALLGSVGQFLGLLLMIVQLVTAGGTFPWQTLPAPLRALHEALPMSHAVDGMRQLMYGGTASAIVAAVIPLLCWLVAGLAATALAARRQGASRRLREVRPSAIGA